MKYSNGINTDKFCGDMSTNKLVVVVGYTFPREQGGGSGTYPDIGVGWASPEVLSVGRQIDELVGQAPPEVSQDLVCRGSVPSCPLLQEDSQKRTGLGLMRVVEF